MSPRLLLTGSLLANVALAVVLFTASPSSRTSSSAGTAEAARSTATGAAPKPASSGTAVTASTPAASEWDRLRTDDLPALADRLRAAGFPPHMRRAILTALVDERFPRFQRLRQSLEEGGPYWKQRGDSAIDEATRGELSKLMRDRETLLERVLGPDFDDESAAAARRLRYGRELPPEKITRLEALERDYAEKRTQLWAGTKGVFLSPDREGVDALGRAERAELAKILSAEELFEYDLRHSAAAMQLRHETQALELGEAEFRALFPLYRAFQEKQPQLHPGATPEQMAAYQAAQQALQAEVKAVLGPARYEDYQLARNYDYQQTAKIAQRVHGSPTAARTVYAVQQDAIQRGRALASDRTLDPSQRAAQLAALNTEVETKITAALGAGGFEAYKENTASQWMRTIQPRPANAKKSP